MHFNPSHLLEHYPEVTALLASSWIGSALIQTMPPPQPLERWYGWFWNFMQVVGANLNLVKK